MKKTITLLSLLFLSVNAIANVGDTTFVQAQNAAHMSWWGEYNAFAAFPPAGTTYRKILMDFKLGCPNIASSCSDWDYTVQVEARHHTGIIDSTLNQAPGFTVDGNTVDSIYFNSDTTYITFYDTLSMSTDSMAAISMQIMIYSDTLNPTTPTDSLWVFPGNYYNYLYNSSGMIYDSVFVGADSLWITTFTPYYVLFEVIENIELGRVMTPYGGSYSVSWNNTWIFDVTDYAPILHDSIEIRAFYGGWSDGFTLTVNFRMIEGTPPRTPVRIRNIYSSGPGGFPFGNTGNPIENYLVPKTFDIDAAESNSLMRVIPSGHGAGTQNCAEFCQKIYHVLVDGLQSFNQAVWRSDCGMNALFPQAGTWLYDRANWCPGEKTIIKNHELTPLVIPGDSVTLDMNFDAYTNSVGGQNPNYIIAAQLITYGLPNFTTDAEVSDIISPNDFFNNRRFNPVCSHPVVIIRNTGSATLTSLDIHYGMEGGVMNTYNWTGNLNFLDTASVVLGSISWGVSSSTFKVYVDNPNAGTDQYAYNDTMRSHITYTPVYPSSFVVVFKTNNAAFETSWKIRDEAGNIVYQSASSLTANTIYLDTVNLANGCYEFIMYDSGKDGLYFFTFNSDGAGYCRFQQANGTSATFKIFDPNFGTQIGQRFTVGYATAAEEVLATPSFFNIFPNPSGGKITLDIALEKSSDMKLAVYSAAGRLVYEKKYAKFKNDILTVDLSSEPSGIYFARIQTSDQAYTKKIVLNLSK
ncbi:MAG TPA: peptide-N-glycosidase F-related protein [Bacteroidia bacterium]|nr:peptide-N-glycosidase F-related protein [Bacteroidia bacterium]